jgi:prepilin-type N-terminal cleavage/methylation domain-containing protein
MDDVIAIRKLVADRRIRQSGFTFIEITVALALLAVAASMLIGMQGAAVRRTLRDIRAQEAMLVGRRIMASIETLKDGDLLLAIRENGSVRDLLQQLNIVGVGDKSESSAISQMTASVTNDELQLEMPKPPNQQVPMRRITLRLTWGPGADESVVLVYQRGPLP